MLFSYQVCIDVILGVYNQYDRPVIRTMMDELGKLFIVIIAVAVCGVFIFVITLYKICAKERLVHILSLFKIYILSYLNFVSKIVS